MYVLCLDLYKPLMGSRRLTCRKPSAATLLEAVAVLPFHWSEKYVDFVAQASQLSEQNGATCKPAI